MKRIVLFSVALFFVACTSDSLDVRYNFDKNADFSKFRTYKWVPMKDAPKIADLEDEEIREVVDAELARKHLTKSDADTADLYIGYQVGLDTEAQFTSYKSDWGNGTGWSRGGWYRGVGGVTTGEISTLHTGQLAVDMYDSKHHSLAWRGIVSKTIDPKALPGGQRRNLAKAVNKLLSSYPPPVKN